MIPRPIKHLVDLLTTLPSIGPRQATRLAFHISNLGQAKAVEFANAMTGLAKIRPCVECFFIHEENAELCKICSDASRKKDLIAIVEKETDLISLERPKKFTGRYLVLGELRRGAVLNEIQKMKLQHLKITLAKTGCPAEEILIATNPTTYGDLAATVIEEHLKDSAKKITRLGRGIPTGGEIEFADEETLGKALDNRG